ncbi:MAG TPA: hypothetical protein VF482_05110 [Trebonia sp.]
MRAWGTPLATAIADIAACRLLGGLSLPPALAGANCSLYQPPRPT